MSTVVTKICATCGTDVSQTKRVKDQQGNYFCTPCWSAKNTASISDSEAKAAPSSARPSQRTCENCEKEIGKLQSLIPWNGHMVCTACHQQLQVEKEMRIRDAAQPKPQATTTTKTVNQADLPHILPPTSTDPNNPEFKLTTGQGIGLIVLSFVVLWLVINAVWTDDKARFEFDLGYWCLRIVKITAVALVIVIPLMFLIARDSRSSKKTENSKGLSDSEALLRSRIRLAIAVAITIVVATVGFFCTWWVYAATWKWNSLLFFTATFGTAAIFFYAIAVALDQLSASRCPNCKLYGMAAIVGKQDLGATESVESATQNVTVREGPLPGGRIIANMEVPTYRRYLTLWWREICQCRKCGCRWTRDKSAKRAI